MKKGIRGFGFVLIAFFVVLLTALAVMLLWNAILPGIMHVTSISYYQALGILILSRLLFGRFGFFGRLNPSQQQHSPRWKSKLASMTNEERSAFRQQWKARCEKGTAGRP